jgi:hypothetical protein
MAGVRASLEHGDGRPQLRVGDRVGRLEVRGPEREQGHEPDEHRRREEPPPIAHEAGEPHHDQQRHAKQDEGEPEHEPPAEHRFPVALVADVVSAVPPDPQNRERHLGEPEEAESEHPEEHPGADRPRRGVADEPHAPARVQREHGDRHEQAEDAD